ncbi:MAG: UDP-2,3-diacylglucosamine diphosphatase [Rhodanobacteraceae bacterium]|nr:UDP-2,3-diacylglucosamine diphosphatase [Rhodanobacteraceae bacterium]
MGAVYLASDLHLTAVEDPVFGRFCVLCQQVAADGQSLYLLGDVFEAWVGDDDDAPLALAVAAQLRQLRDAGIDIGFMHGNRDFLVGAGFAERAGARLLGDTEFVELAGRRVALLHGDTLCTDDTQYQAIRRQLRDPRWQQQFLAQPLAARRAFAAKARAESAAHTAMAAAEIMDVNATAVSGLLAETGADWIIHGHTHRPAVHDLGNGRRRIVLGDWPRAASWLRVEGEGGTLHYEGRELAISA